MDREYMTTLDKTLARYFSLNGQKSVEGSITRVESALSFLSPAYLNDLVRVETGKALAGYVRVKMMEFIRKQVSKEGCPLEQIARELGLCKPRLLDILYRQVFGHQSGDYQVTPDYKLN